MLLLLWGMDLRSNFTASKIIVITHGIKIHMVVLRENLGREGCLELLENEWMNGPRGGRGWLGVWFLEFVSISMLQKMASFEVVEVDHHAPSHNFLIRMAIITSHKKLPERRSTRLPALYFLRRKFRRFGGPRDGRLPCAPVRTSGCSPDLDWLRGRTLCWSEIKTF